MNSATETKKLMAESNETIDLLRRLTVRLETFNDRLEEELTRLEHAEPPDVRR